MRDPELALAGADERCEGGYSFRLEDADGHAVVGPAEPADQPGERLAGECREGADVEPAGGESGHAGDGGRRPLEAPQGLPGRADERFARRSRPEPAADAMEERDPALALERAQGLRHRRLGRPQLQRGQGDATLVDDRQEGAQPPFIHTYS